MSLHQAGCQIHVDKILFHESSPARSDDKNHRFKSRQRTPTCIYIPEEGRSLVSATRADATLFLFNLSHRRHQQSLKRTPNRCKASGSLPTQRNAAQRNFKHVDPFPQTTNQALRPRGAARQQQELMQVCRASVAEYIQVEGSEKQPPLGMNNVGYAAKGTRAGTAIVMPCRCMKMIHLPIAGSAAYTLTSTLF
jgi:hypothetical protein